MIAPMAVATSTMLTARPRQVGAARSALAYRACRLVATMAVVTAASCEGSISHLRG
jgi:hypothetical protein